MRPHRSLSRRRLLRLLKARLEDLSIQSLVQEVKSLPTTPWLREKSQKAMHPERQEVMQPPQELAQVREA